MSGDPIDLDAIEARAAVAPREGRLTQDHLDALPTVQCHCGRRMHMGVSDQTLALVAEVRRLTIESELRWLAGEALAARAKEAEAEVRRLRAERDAVARHRFCRDCGATLEQCSRYRLGRAVKCCPDCRHP